MQNLPPGVLRPAASTPPGSAWVFDARRGLVLPSHVAAHRRLRAIDLFCGAGGFSLGLLQSDFEVLAGVDIDPSSSATYAFNIGARPMRFHFVEAADREAFVREVVEPFEGGVTLSAGDEATFPENKILYGPRVGHFFLGDVRKINGAQLCAAIGVAVGSVDMVCGGPPCQGFSVLGKREVMDPRNSLVFDFARLILEIRPRSFIFENVPGIVSMVTPEGIPVLDVFCHILAQGRYADYGALKKALAQQAGSWAVLEGQGTHRPQRSGARRQRGRAGEPAAEQRALFGDE